MSGDEKDSHVHEADTIIAALRKRCYSKVQTIKSLADTYGLPLEVAKQRVQNSAAWDDLRERDDRFHRVILRSLIEADETTHELGKTRQDQEDR